MRNFDSTSAALPLGRIAERALRASFRSKVTVLLILFALLSGCGPTVDLKPEYEKLNPQLVALLPIKFSADVREQRIAYLSQSFRSSLESAGFAVVDSSIVEAECLDQQCSGRAQLLAKYPIQALFDLNLEQISRNNFGLGYYNTISGTLRLTNRNNEPLALVKHTEREKGGLVFESGQVIQGIISQVRNSGDEAYNQLADKFARTITSKLPKPKIQTQSRPEQTSIGTVDVMTIRPDVYQVCAEAPSGLSTSLLYNRNRVSLRPIADGRYCGIFRLEKIGIDSATPIVEARSPFGEATRREVQIPFAPLCSLEGRVFVMPQGENLAIKIDCRESQSSDRSVARNQKNLKDTFRCELSTAELTATKSSCLAAKFLVYRTLSESGPYEKIAEIQSSTWIDKNLKSIHPPVSASTASTKYTVVAVRSDGGLSDPVTVSATK